VRNKSRSRSDDEVFSALLEDVRNPAGSSPKGEQPSGGLRHCPERPADRYQRIVEVDERCIPRPNTGTGETWRGSGRNKLLHDVHERCRARIPLSIERMFEFPRAGKGSSAWLTAGIRVTQELLELIAPKTHGGAKMHLQCRSDARIEVVPGRGRDSRGECRRGELVIGHYDEEAIERLPDLGALPKTERAHQGVRDAVAALRRQIAAGGA
jgi:hypothetical protein